MAGVSKLATALKRSCILVLAAVLATSFLLISETPKPAGAVASGNGCDTFYCTFLRVKLSTTPTGEVTVHASRSVAAYDKSFDLRGTSDPKVFTSGNRIYDTANDPAMACGQPTSDDYHKRTDFTITVSGPGVQETATKQFNICGDSQAEGGGSYEVGNDGLPTRTITVNVSTAAAPSAKGGIKGVISVRDTFDPDVQACDQGSSMLITGPNNYRTNQPINGTEAVTNGQAGVFNTGLNLAPGRYHISGTCPIHDTAISEVGIQIDGDVTVEAGKTAEFRFTQIPEGAATNVTYPTTTVPAPPEPFDPTNVIKLSNGLAFVALLTCVGGIFVSSGLWAIGSKGQNPGQELTGKRGLVLCVTAAFFVGAAPNLINFFNTKADEIENDPNNVMGVTPPTGSLNLDFSHVPGESI